MSGLCDEDKGGRGIQESFEGMRRKEKINWKGQRKMDRRSGQGWEEDVEVQESEKVGRGRRCLEAED